MNDKMGEARSFQKLLNLRNIYKQLNQQTWAVRAIEERYSYEVPENTEPLLYQYTEIAKQIIQSADDLRKEIEQK